MKLNIPELSLVVLVGASGAGKSTFAARHFLPTEILSSDRCRALVSDDENNMDATKPAFEVLHFIAAKRLAAGKLTVIDATNVKPEDRKPLVDLARTYHCLPVAIVLDLPEALCRERNRLRPDRQMGAHVVRNHVSQLRRSKRHLKREGFRHIFFLESEEEIEQATIERQPLWNNRKSDHGPFDIVGDIHGCYDELVSLMERLGYRIDESTGGSDPRIDVIPPPGRKIIFLGDLVDRGPKIPHVLRLVMGMVESGQALCVPGNHDIKLMRQINGKDVKLAHGLEQSVAQLSSEPEAFRRRVADFIDALVSHYVLDGGRLVVAHAGMKAEMQGRGSGGVREFALYGETTGETDDFGLPVRLDWAADYRGEATVVYGHTPVPEPQWLNRTINIDTGCVFGGALTALRWPERELVSVPAAQEYAISARPLTRAPGSTPQQLSDDLLDLEDVTGKRIVQTRLHHAITVDAENAAAALEAVSRFAINPKWLIYVPPTMSPSETSQEPGLLEHPAEAFEYYRRHGVPQVICQQKHMGSRAVVILCRNAATAQKRFGVTAGEGAGMVYSRTGRPFFNNADVEIEFLARVRAAADRTDWWTKFDTDWICLDCELMPWSAKAQELLRGQYAPVGVAAIAALTEEERQLAAAQVAGHDVSAPLAAVRGRLECAHRYDAAWRRYCWPVAGVDDLRVAPFHFLATEGAVHADKDHLWHMQELAALSRPDEPLVINTPYRIVDLENPQSTAAAVQWWEELTEAGGEGMVVKPLAFVARAKRGLLQPAIKCRGREYLRIIYGPEYTLPANLDRLRKRGVARKRSLALREFALGIEALERFVQREPLRRIHECCFAVLALESERIDPRL